MAKKKQKHDGSILRRGENTWRVFVSGGVDKDGKRVRKSFTVHGSHPEAQQAQRRAQRELLQNGPSSSMQLKEWAETWLAEGK